MKNIDIVLIEPKTSGNVGAIARVMANFDFSKLVIVNSQCDINDDECRNRAKHAQTILDKAKQIDFEKLKKYDLIVGTTAKLGNQYNIKRLAITPKELKSKLPKNKKVAIVFGTEGDGLTNEQINMCDFVMSIPASSKYKTLNLSQSVGIILYELFDAKPSFDMVDRKQISLIDKLIDEIIPKVGISDEKKTATQKKTFRKLLNIQKNLVKEKIIPNENNYNNIFPDISDLIK